MYTIHIMHDIGRIHYDRTPIFYKEPEESDSKDLVSMHNIKTYETGLQCAQGLAKLHGYEFENLIDSYQTT